MEIVLASNKNHTVFFKTEIFSRLVQGINFFHKSLKFFDYLKLEQKFKASIWLNLKLPSKSKKVDFLLLNVLSRSRFVADLVLNSFNFILGVTQVMGYSSDEITFPRWLTFQSYITLKWFTEVFRYIFTRTCNGRKKSEFVADFTFSC